MTSSHTPTLPLHRERLLQERAQLLQRIAEQRGGLVSRDVRSFDDRAQAISERNDEFAMNEHETAELGDIEAALARMDGGTYGQCTECGMTIAPARLNAYPTAKRCIDCQTVAEQRR